MKKLLAILLGALTLTASAQNITISWDYPGTVDDDLEFVVYHSSTLTTPLASWGVFTNVPGTQTHCDVQVALGANYFYVVSSSIFWGTNAAPSNVASTPSLPVPAINNRIRKK